MAEVKLTKNELRHQQIHFAQLEKYLPTLQLKKAMLQAEVLDVRHLIQELFREEQLQKKQIEAFSALLAKQTIIDLQAAVRVTSIQRRYENIAGVEVPFFSGIEFETFEYSLFETPPWVDMAIVQLRHLVSMHAQIQVAEEKRKALEQEWREVSIRVNLFEKILIPRALEAIRTIRVFLGDQQLAAVSRAKVAKTKIEAQQDVSKKRRGGRA